MVTLQYLISSFKVYKRAIIQTFWLCSEHGFKFYIENE